jgi:DNA-binding NarL/FixJ family response regulator
MLTVFEDADKIFGAIKAGANGYLIKKDPPKRSVMPFLVCKTVKRSEWYYCFKVMEYFKKQADAAPTWTNITLLKEKRDP